MNGAGIAPVHCALLARRSTGAKIGGFRFKCAVVTGPAWITRISGAAANHVRGARRAADKLVIRRRRWAASRIARGALFIDRLGVAPIFAAASLPPGCIAVFGILLTKLRAEEPRTQVHHGRAVVADDTGAAVIESGLSIILTRCVADFTNAIEGIADAAEGVGYVQSMAAIFNHSQAARCGRRRRRDAGVAHGRPAPRLHGRRPRTWRCHCRTRWRRAGIRHLARLRRRDLLGDRACLAGRACQCPGLGRTRLRLRVGRRRRAGARAGRGF